MVPIPDKTTVLESTPNGIHLSATSPAMKIDEDFDNNMLLTRAHVVSAENEVVAYPTFADTPKGRTISEVKSEVHQPPTAPVVLVKMGATYQNVDRYEIPARLHFEVQNVMQVDFTLNRCTVNGAKPAP